MQLRVCFVGDEKGLDIHFHYNKALQGIVYQKIRESDPLLATLLHDRGTKDPETVRRLKLFTFSRLLSARKPEIDVEKKSLRLGFPITWIVASPLREFVVALYNGFLKSGCVTLHKSGVGDEQTMRVRSLWIESEPKFSRPVLVETLSPITVYKTEEKDGKKFTRYLSPADPEFSRLVLENLCRKYRTLSGAQVSFGDEAYIKPVRTPNHETVIYYEDTLIKAWSGVFELNLPKELFSVAFSCGLGAKNSQGFGCVGLWRGNG